MAVKTKATILSEIAANVDDNTSGNVTPSDVRTRLEDMTDSLYPEVGTMKAVSAATALTTYSLFGRF